jgi:hypothetical protein
MGRILAIIGSGETGPTMVTTHQELLAGGGVRSGVLLDSPYRFQENAAEVSAKAVRYFTGNVGLPVEVLNERVPVERAVAQVRASDWVFAGPGSPSYALTELRGGALAEALRYRLTAGDGVTVLASAAACVLGALALPVYEIYKAGAPPHWLDGLDLLAPLGLPVTVISHYDNAEGGTHDTRYCYLGERRLRRLEAELPDGTAVLGVDEHTALIIDLLAGTIQVRGRGGVTVRRCGTSDVLPAGTASTLAHLQAMIAGEPSPPRPLTTATPESPEEAAAVPVLTLTERVDACQRRFDGAFVRADPAAMSQAVLDLDDALADWASDTDIDEAEHARTVLRSLVVRLGETAQRPPAAAVDALLALRERLREDRAYRRADAVRHALALAGIEVQDTPDGPRWHPAPATPPSR